MKKYKVEIFLGIIFLSLSFVLYAIHYYFFHDFNLMMSDLTAQLGYLPIYVFLTTVIIEQLLSRRARAEMLRKVNTIVGVFYSEIGNELIKRFIKFDLNIDSIKKDFKALSEWDDEKCKYLKGVILNYNLRMNYDLNDLQLFKQFLFGSRELLLNLMSNPNLMEHQSFTELLLSVFHLVEEFKSRGEFSKYNEEDFAHLRIDMERAYKLLINEWVNYMIHLKKEYPYLHSLAIRTNPFIY